MVIFEDGKMFGGPCWLHGAAEQLGDFAWGFLATMRSESKKNTNASNLVQFGPLSKTAH